MQQIRTTIVRKSYIIGFIDLDEFKSIVNDEEASQCIYKFLFKSFQINDEKSQKNW